MASPEERPILFSAPMVRALLKGRKTVTRRIIPADLHIEAVDGPLAAWQVKRYQRKGKPMVSYKQAWPYGPYPLGPRYLWVKENAFIAPPNFGDSDQTTHTDPDGQRRVVSYAASMSGESVRCAKDYGLKMKPSIFMPRWASRLTLRVKAARVERLHEISEADAQAEGVPFDGRWWRGGTHPIKGTQQYWPTAREAFEHLWCDINGAKSWKANPYVWCVSFEVVRHG